MGRRGAGHAGLRFTDLKLDPKYLLGEEGTPPAVRVGRCRGARRPAAPAASAIASEYSLQKGR